MAQDNQFMVWTVAYKVLWYKSSAQQIDGDSIRPDRFSLCFISVYGAPDNGRKQNQKVRAVVLRLQ